MTRPLRLVVLLALAISPVLLAAEGDSATRTGWFSDEWCAVSKVKSDKVGPNNRDCVQKCLKKGAKMVFIDEKAKAMYEVENPEVASGQESHYVQVAGTVAANGKTIRLGSVKVLETYKASCSVPKN